MVLALVGFFALRGAIKGFVWQLLRTAGLVAGLFLAARYDVALGRFLAERFAFVPDGGSDLVGWATVVIGTFLVVTVVAHLSATPCGRPASRAIDRLLGAGLGALLGLLIAAFGFTLWASTLDDAEVKRDVLAGPSAPPYMAQIIDDREAAVPRRHPGALGPGPVGPRGVARRAPAGCRPPTADPPGRAPGGASVMIRASCGRPRGGGFSRWASCSSTSSSAPTSSRASSPAASRATGSAETKFGSQLVVRDYQAAIFRKDGKGGRRPRGRAPHADHEEHPDPDEPPRAAVRVQEPVPLRGGLRQPAHDPRPQVGDPRARRRSATPSSASCGCAPSAPTACKVADPRLFCNALVGADGLYTTSELEEYLRSSIMTRLTDCSASSSRASSTSASQYEELSAALLARLADDFSRFGLAIDNFRLNAVTPPEEVQKAIDERRRWARSRTSATTRG